MQNQQPSLEDEWGREIVARAEMAGIDLGLLSENLRLTPLERMRQHDTSVRRILAARSHLGIDDDNES